MNQMPKCTNPLKGTNTTSHSSLYQNHKEANSPKKI